MSIDKYILWSMLHRFINARYNGSDRNTLLWLTKMVVMHHPEHNCIKKGRVELWKELPENKSLFTCGECLGLPIGNLTSQCFANFYLGLFDRKIKAKYNYYGRYVDDFFVVTQNKSYLLNNIANISKCLFNTLHIKLHPKKLYIQHYSKGVKFTGAVVKKCRSYIANATVCNMYKKIYMYNHHIDDTLWFKFTQSLNSYFGFMKHHLTYAIKRKVTRMIDPKWYRFIEVNALYTKFKHHDTRH